MQKVLYVRSGSRYRVAKSVEILEAAAFCEARKFEANRPKLAAPADAESFLIGQLRHCEEEFFCIVHLDNRMSVIAVEKMFRGTINAAPVFSREVVREVIGRNSAAVILAHNHPAGVAYPSTADREVTSKLKAALALIDVQILDHIIVGDNACYSFAMNGDL